MTVLILQAGFRQAIVVMHFKLNQESIEQAFCENKGRPELECHGICHLKKELQKTRNDDQNQIAILIQKLETLPTETSKIGVVHRIPEIGNRTFIFINHRYTEPCKEIFVPPPIV